MRIAGYLVNHPEGLRGDRGLAYEYVLASNGLFVRGEKLGPGGVPLLRATVLVTEASVRGLAPLEASLELPQGKAPEFCWHTFLAVAARLAPQEVYGAVCWHGADHLEVPAQTAGGAHIEYSAVPDTVVDVHSHGHMGAWFSGTDDADDTGFWVSIVVGRFDQLIHEVEARVSLYGHHARLYVGDIFG